VGVHSQINVKTRDLDKKLGFEYGALKLSEEREHLDYSWNAEGFNELQKKNPLSKEEPII